MKAIQHLAVIVSAVLGIAAHADTNAPQTFRLMGKVADAAGQPVAGAAVECYQQATAGPFMPGEMKMNQRATTGANGGFDLQIARATTLVIARKTGLAPAWSQYWNPTADPPEEHLVLTSPTTLAGTVVDEADKPVPAAEVWVAAAYSEKTLDENSRSFSYLSGKPAREYFSTRTTADGQFRLEGFPTNAVADLGVSSPGKVLREPRREYVSPETMLCRAGQQDIKLVVEPAGNIEGQVTAQEPGQGLAGASLSLQADQPGYSRLGEREPAQSGADGMFRLADVAAGTYRIHTLFGTNAVPEWVAETVPVSVEAGRTTRNVRVSATRGGFLEVAVIGKDDRKPLPGVGVSALKDAFQAGGNSGTNGLGLLRLPPGEYRVSAYREASSSEPTTVRVETGTTNHVEIALSPPPKITGTVRDPAGAAVAGLRLMVFGGYGHSGNDIKTDANGRYELSWNPQRYGRPDAAFSLIARDEVRNLASAQDIDEATTTLDLRLDPGLVVFGRVEDEKGRPLTNASVRLYLWSGNMGSQIDNKPIRSDAQGRFEIAALPPDRRYSMDATAKGYGSANQQIQRDDTETNRVELPPFVLRVADRRLAGQVVDADEKPVGGANVFMYGDGQPNASVRTDEQGWFKYDQVCEGQVRLSASHQNGSGNTTAEAGDTNVVIRLAARESVVRDAPRRLSLKGKPLPDLAAIDFAANAAPTGQPLLLCLFDLEQRPSRRCVRLLMEQHDALKQKGLAVIAVQAAATTAESFQTWKDANPAPFPMGRVPDKSDKTKWVSQVESLPWLILADKAGRVAAEGFTLDDLEAKIKELP